MPDSAGDTGTKTEQGRSGAPWDSAMSLWSAVSLGLRPLPAAVVRPV